MFLVAELWETARYERGVVGREDFCRMNSFSPAVDWNLCTCVVKGSWACGLDGLSLEERIHDTTVSPELAVALMEIGPVADPWDEVQHGINGSSEAHPHILRVLSRRNRAKESV